MKEMQKYTQGKIPPDKLPFDLTAELGEVVDVELRSPGVYYLALTDGERHPEVYVVTKDAPAISEKARSYGQKFLSYPDLRVYDLHQPCSGRYVIDFEILRYQMKRHLPEIETEDSLQTAALYGAEEHPDYFGNFPVPLFTPRGCTPYLLRGCAGRSDRREQKPRRRRVRPARSAGPGFGVEPQRTITNYWTPQKRKCPSAAHSEVVFPFFV